jgi:hypothetical protein
MPQKVGITDSPSLFAAATASSKVKEVKGKKFASAAPAIPAPAVLRNERLFTDHVFFWFSVIMDSPYDFRMNII